jgi:hypothetical protein
VLGNLIASYPLYKPSASSIGLQYDASQFQLNGSNQLQIKSGVLTPNINLTTTGSSGASTYNASTGALNIPNYTLSGLGGEPAISKSTGFLKWNGVSWIWDTSSYLTSFNETDPNVPSWAKAPDKPSYSWSEIQSKPGWESKLSYVTDTVKINSNLFVSGQIGASKDVISWMAGAVGSDVLGNLTTLAPLWKPSASQVGIKLNTSQFEVNASSELQIKPGVLTPAAHTHYQLYQPNGTNPFVYTDNSGILHIDGGIVQNGASYETHAQNVYTTNNYINLRDGAVSGLGSGEYAGIVAKKYDGVTDGRLVFDNTGTARVGDVGDEQPLVTRIESPTNGYIPIWDAAHLRLDFMSPANWNTAYTWGNHALIGYWKASSHPSTLSGYGITDALALGETSTTAYRGDRGKIAYDYSQVGHVPLSDARITNWNTAFGWGDHASVGYVKFSYPASLNYLMKVTGSGTIGNSLISDDGTTVWNSNSSDNGDFRVGSHYNGLQLFWNNSNGTNYISPYGNTWNIAISAGGGFVGVGYTADPTSGNKFAVNGNSYIGGDLTLSKSVATGNTILREIVANNSYGSGYSIAKIQTGTGVNYYDGYISFFTNDYGYAGVLSERGRFDYNGLSVKGYLRSDSGNGFVELKGNHGNSGYIQAYDSNSTSRSLSLNPVGSSVLVGYTSDTMPAVAALLVTNGNGYFNGSITAASEITAYSDGRIKKVIGETKPVLEKVMKVNVVDYERTDLKDSLVRTGVIAQQLRELFPYYVKGEESKEMLSVNYSEFVSIAIKAIQELNGQVQELKKELDQEKKHKIFKRR